MSLAEQIPTRSSAALSALDIFYTNFNEVNFYVEDIEQENLYFAILKKHFPAIIFSKIFPLGGKSAVLAHAKNSINKKSKTKNIYIVDQDFDHLLGRVEKIKNVFYLERYCIENYLIEADAIVEVIIENNPKLKSSDVVDTLGLVGFFDQINLSLKELFILFYAAQLFQLGIANCAIKPEKFCNTKSRWKIDEDRVNEYRKTIVSEAKPPKIDPPLIDLTADIRLQSARTANSDQLVSGKYILTIIFHYVKSRYSLGSITFDSFVYRVAKNSALESMAPIASKIKKYISPGRLQKKKRPSPVDG
ncbi:MAG: DUF4435 domain-containing protein [Burkholderiales bacterium]|jgi:hypothetical protein|nr:DUF4435 domain-containing protein [Burkholderiales bacterium]